MKTDIQRKRGQFYTPTLFVDYAHDMISKEFGEDWKEKYVVWDNSAGSKNLTRDYYFNELYSSTLEQAELDISKHYNKEAVSFQFDFLNDPLTKLPKGLLEAFEQNKPIIFFMNPPYGTACNQGETSKSGINNTMVRSMMINDELGAGAENLQHQFIYRIIKFKEKYNLSNCHIAMFTKPIYLTGGKQDKFLDLLTNNFKFENGVIFQASNFADVSSAWGITFNIWRCGQTIDKNNFNHSVIEMKEGEIATVDEKILYNVNNATKASEWVREQIKGIKGVDYPNLTNALNIKQEKTYGSMAEDALGYFHNNANSVQYNQTYVGFYGSPFAAAHGLSILPQNFTRCTSLFSARKLVAGNWINDKDEYMKPNVEHEKWQEFENDSIVYSLFNTSSNQSSLRQVDYKGKKWDIKNEFFFMSKEEMLGLSEEFSNDDCYNDARVSKERYVYKLLQGIELSDEAQAVLDKARELVRKTFKYRKLFNEEHENYQINNWDASYYQMKPLWKEYAKEDFEQFKELYKKLADKMRPMVYELGFLKR